MIWHVPIGKNLETPMAMYYVCRNAGKMNSVTLTSHVLDSTQQFREVVNKKGDSYAITTAFDTARLNEALYKTSYNLIVLENKWVKGVYTYIDGSELVKLTGINNLKLLKVHDDVLRSGICRLKNRVRLFKKMEYSITGIWDY